MSLEARGLDRADGAAEAVAVARPRPARRTRLEPWRAAWELLHDLSVAVLFCFFLITFVAQAFRVQGTSMEPLLHDGDRIVVNKFIYRFESIARGDVVVFWFPRDPSTSFIKRVVALPGDTVEMRLGHLYVNGREAPETYPAADRRDLDSFPPTAVTAGHYFVLGDNRRGSNDSRSWGEVPERYIYGRAIFRFWPPTHLGAIR